MAELACMRSRLMPFENTTNLFINITTNNRAWLNYYQLISLKELITSKLLILHSHFPKISTYQLYDTAILHLTC